MLQKIIDIIMSIKLKDVISVSLIILLSFLLIKSCGNNTNLKSQYDNNIHALTDTISYYESKIGSLVATKTAYESDIKELKIVNEKLYQDIEDMKIKKNKVETAINVSGEIQNELNDTVYIVKNDTIYKGFDYDFNFSNKWRTLSGVVSYKPDSLQLKFNEDKVKFDYTVVMDKDNKIYIKSDNPYVNFNELTGFSVQKSKPKKFGLSLYGGYGFDFVSRKFVPSAGVAVTWDIIQF